MRDQGAPADATAQDKSADDGEVHAFKEDEADSDDRADAAPAAPPPPSARGPGGAPSRPSPRPVEAAPRGGDMERSAPSASSGSSSGSSVSRGAVAAEAPRRAPRPEPSRLERRVSRNQAPSAIASDDAQGDTGGAAWPPRNAPAPLQGTLANIDRAIKAGNVKSALSRSVFANAFARLMPV